MYSLLLNEVFKSLFFHPEGRQISLFLHGARVHHEVDPQWTTGTTGSVHLSQHNNLSLQLLQVPKSHH